MIADTPTVSCARDAFGGQTPNVSIVVPVYNAAPWVAETLRSAFAQTLGPTRLELIVVDDASTDGSMNIVEGLVHGAPMSCRILRLADNGGPSRARNVGWRSAAGAWIQFLDADDLLHPRKLEIQAEVGRRQPEDVAVVCSDWKELHCVGGRWEPLPPRLCPAIGEDAVADLLRDENIMITGVPLFRRHWLERVGGWDERHRLIEDNDLLLRLAMGGARFAHAASEEPLFFYRVRPDSVSRSCNRQFVEGCLRNAKLAEAYWRARGGPTPDQAKGLAEAYNQAIQFYADRDREQWRYWLDELHRLLPSYVPAAPGKLRTLSRLLGFRRAAGVARRYQLIRRRLASLRGRGQ